MKKRQTIGKRILAHLLTIVMLLTSVPVSALDLEGTTVATETAPTTETIATEGVQMPGLDAEDTGNEESQIIDSDDSKNEQSTDEDISTEVGEEKVTDDEEQEAITEEIDVSNDDDQDAQNTETEKPMKTRKLGVKDVGLLGVAGSNMVTITYEAGAGGNVSLETESIDLDDENSTAAGSTATANEEHIFSNWTDTNNNIVSTSATFIPQKPSETGDITYIANFVENVWLITFLDRDNQIVETRRVIKGNPIGELPETIAREDYIAYWAVGTSSEGGQGTEWTAEDRITAAYVPDADATIVPDYEKVTHSVSFFEDEGLSEFITTKTVDVDTSFYLNDIPVVPVRDGYLGKWVYSGGDFSNTIHITEDINVWPSYEQNVFTVKYIVNGSTYQTDSYDKNEKIIFPSDPTIEGKEFLGWYVGETQYTGNETVVEDLTLEARFSNDLTVKFVVLDDNEEPIETFTQYFSVGAGEKINVMPQDPFISGKVFDNWVIRGTDTIVTADTIVEDDITVVAMFHDITVYEIHVEYFYFSDDEERIVFETQILSVDAEDLPYRIKAPVSTQTDSEHVSGAPIYYPSTPSLEVVKSDFDENRNCSKSVEFVSHTAEYDYVYVLKDLSGDGYTEIPDSREENVEGVLWSYVTPTVKDFDYAVLESAEEVEITQEQGQELYVKYTRKDVSLSYDTNGGSYVEGCTVPYGTSVGLSTTIPTRTGYTFDGWYSDEALTQRVRDSVIVNGNTTLYAKWKGDTVDYTIIYLKEEYKNSTNTTSFVYDNSRTASGVVGTTVYAANAPAISMNGYEKLNSINGTATAAGSGEDTAVVISADGSTVLKVYYSLIRYTLVFNANQGTITINGQDYTGSNYKIENLVLGQAMGDLWPASSTEIHRNNRYFNGWTGGPSTYITKQYELVWNHVMNADNRIMTYTASWDNSSHNRNAFYWLQQADGTYKIESAYTQIGLNTNNLGAKEIDGFSKHNGDGTRPDTSYPNSGNGEYTVWVEEHEETYDTGGHTSPTPSNNEMTITRTVDGITVTCTYVRSESYYWFGFYYRYYYTGVVPGHNITRQGYNYNFYYDRAKYQIDYYYGSTKINTIADIYFEADISTSTYNYTPEKPSDLDEDYFWRGWYEDAGFQTEYTFDTMPGHNVVLYAKWEAPSFNVDFEMDGGTPAVEAISVKKYQKVEKPVNPTKDGYTFEGWFTSADGNELYDWNNQIISDTTIYAHWTQNALSFTVHYVNENGERLAPDRIITNPNFVLGQIVTEDAITITGFRPDAGSKNVTLTADNNQNEITFIYKPKVANTSYIVRYILDPVEYPDFTEEIPVAEEKSVDISGDVLSVIEYAKAVDYSLISEYTELNGLEFYPDKSEKELILSADANANVLVFKYSQFKNTKVSVHFVDMDGNNITETDTNVYKIGETFSLNRAAIAGWELNKVVEGTDYDGALAGVSYKISTSEERDFTLFYQKKATVTVKSESKQYDGTILALGNTPNEQVTVAGLIDRDELTSVNLTYINEETAVGGIRGRINAGVATVTPSNAVIGNHENSNYYHIRYISGSLEVRKINVTVRIEPDRWTNNTYNGNVYKAGFTNSTKSVDDYIIITNPKYKIEHLNDIWNVVKSKATYDEAAVGLQYYVFAEKNVSDQSLVLPITVDDLPKDDNYSVSLFVRNARLQILPKALTISTGSDSKYYDGTELTNSEASISGLVDGETADISATGTQTEVGSSENTYDITWETAVLGNYTIKTENLGTLTVNPASLSIVVKNAAKHYDGSKQSGYSITGIVAGNGNVIETDEYIVTGLANGQTLTISGYEPASGTNAGFYSNGSFGNATIQIQSGETVVTGFYEISTTPGMLTIGKSGAMTLTATPYSDAFDGDENTISVSVVVPDGSSATVSYSTDNETWSTTAPTWTDVTAAQTVYVKAENDNYETATGQATVTITPREITVSVPDEYVMYDGTEQSGNTSYTFTGLVNDHVATISYTPSKGTLVDVYDNGSYDENTLNIKNGDIEVTSNYMLVQATTGKLTISNDVDCSMDVNKTVTNTPAEGSFGLGDNIEYQITVTNTGNVPYTNVEVTDEMTGFTTTIESLEVGQMMTFNTSHVVTSEDILAGSIVNVVTAQGDDIPNPDDPTNPVVPSGDDTVITEPDDIDGTMSVQKTVTSTQSTYNVGDVLTYKINVINMGNVPFINIVVNDELTGLSETIDVLNPLESRTFETSYTVTSEDILKGSVTNVATSKADDIPDPKDPENPVVPQDDDTVTVETDDLDTSMTVEKIVTNGAGNRVFGLGETIEYQILVTNTGNVDYTNVVVIDELTGLTETIALLGRGETRTFNTSYTVTSDDILKGSVVNVVTAEGDDIPDPKMQDPETPSSEDDVEVPTTDVNATLTVDKNVTSGRFYRAGDVITYEIVVTNTGNVPYANVVVTDNLTGLRSVIPTLGVGQSRTFTTSYTVTEADITRGYVENEADAVGEELPDDRHTIPLGEDSVVTPVAQQVTLQINYRYEDGTQATDPFNRTYTYGNNYSVTSPTIEGYTVNITTVAGTITSDTVVDVTYTRNAYTLTVNYVNTATGAVMYAPYTAVVPYGDTYTVASPAFNGYTRTHAAVTGTMPGHDVQVTVFYTPIPTPRPNVPAQVGDTIIEDYDTPLGLGAVGLNAGDSIE